MGRMVKGKEIAYCMKHFHLRLFTRKPFDIETHLAGLLAWLATGYLPMVCAPQWHEDPAVERLTAADRKYLPAACSSLTLQLRG